VYCVKNKGMIILWFFIISFIFGFIEALTEHFKITNPLGFTLTLIFVVGVFAEIGVKSEKT